MFTPPRLLRPTVNHVCAALCGLLFCAQAAYAGLVVYSNDFQSAVGSQLSSTSGSLGIDTSPSGRKFLGRADGNPTLGLNNETVTLSLTGLSTPHTTVTILLDLFIIHSWVGNDSTSRWQAGHSGSPANLQDTTFSNVTANSQCYPVNCPAANAFHSGAFTVNSLGYSGAGDSIYRLTYMNILDSASTFNASFTGLGLQGIATESWGLGSLRVETEQGNWSPNNQNQGGNPPQGGGPPPNPVPEPATLALLGIGLVGLALSRRKAF